MTAALVLLDIELRAALARLPSDAWLDVTEAALYLRMSASGLRSAIHRGELGVDGRGAHRCACFRKASLDHFIERRLGDYARAQSETPEAGSHGESNEQKESLGHRESWRRPIPSESGRDESQDGETASIERRSVGHETVIDVEPGKT